MKQWLDFVPLFLFFAAYKLYGIFPATAVLVGASIVVYGGIWIADRKLEKNHVITLVATIAFGSITLLLRDENWLKWKAPIINWIFAVVFLASHFIGDKVVIERMLGHALQVPTQVWQRLNIAWVLFFIFAGAANLYVAFTYTQYWVDFKVFGSLGMTLVFLIGQMFYLSRYLPGDDENKSGA